MLPSRVLLIDIETSPNIGYTWGTFETDVIEVMQPWHLLSFAYKWLGGKTRCVALPDKPGYKPGCDDKAILKDLWDILNEADVVIAQNGDEFDIKKINTRFIKFGMMPPAPYKTIDTLKIARGRFAFNSNRLNDLGQFLGCGEKMKHQGFGLWKGCMAGDKKAWATMKAYNIKDVDLLEKIYLQMRPWANTHPNVALVMDHVCPRCKSKNLQSRGRGFAQNSAYIRYQCQACGAWSRGAKLETATLK